VGYAWNVPKSDWLNVGCGTLDATAVRAAWRTTHDRLRAAGHLPEGAEPALAHVKGHSYYLFDPAHLEGAARVDDDRRGGAFLIGDALGLAHPVTAEGIAPAAISGRCLAEAILAGAPDTYAERLRRHPVLADYRRLHGVLAAASAVRRRRPPRPGTRRGLRVPRRAVARGFAWMFSGARLPAPRLLDLLLSLSHARSHRADAER